MKFLTTLSVLIKLVICASWVVNKDSLVLFMWSACFSTSLPRVFSVSSALQMRWPATPVQVGRLVMCGCIDGCSCSDDVHGFVVDVNPLIACSLLCRVKVCSRCQVLFNYCADLCGPLVCSKANLQHGYLTSSPLHGLIWFCVVLAGA